MVIAISAVGGRCPAHPSGEQWDLAVLLAAHGEESRELALQSLGGYPVLLLDRCAGGGFLQPQHTESKADFGRSNGCKSVKIELHILYPVQLLTLLQI